MELKLPTQAQLKRAYEDLLTPAFPPSELKPLRAITAMQERGLYRPYCLFDGEDLVGACFLWYAREGWALVDYLCVAAPLRGRGIGAEALKMLQRAQPSDAFILESEAVCDAPDRDLARRRLLFYERCGASLAGYDTEIFGVHYRTLLLAPFAAEDETVMREHERIYQTSFSEEKYRRYVRIPWDGVSREKTDWDE
ncbi:MAG: GNAT family N-acetyltransferase [Oscillibacter sp.]|nr:GNAT family N-acetyltransferase [Oscillibacter sp.]